MKAKIKNWESLLEPFDLNPVDRMTEEDTGTPEWLLDYYDTYHNSIPTFPSLRRMGQDTLAALMFDYSLFLKEHEWVTLDEFAHKYSCLVLPEDLYEGRVEYGDPVYQRTFSDSLETPKSSASPEEYIRGRMLSIRTDEGCIYVEVMDRNACETSVPLGYLYRENRRYRLDEEKTKA